ncbi:ectoine/hydroxyectoine ABC transporter permease subunit EhuD [Pseudovibrio exalbescens]|uniref:Ectoine/hydroxyectoine ABC transporter permease subunit EhuD n=1 Tax=Pseudovibrio exalbescens TaxID=197461 RepID=A0A1U7JLU3_9HYPH|nr:ectoine/hydroxyectoine ABC transporter permease subunit EhuD [Pseudovibrio exalbescens]OKL45658.1 ectoine/hydroxyectoine ABC transporter permease subunit EhuD [Pseudovibrio exalbescens]
MEWDWQFVIESLPTLWQGVVVTIQATALGSVLALTVGLFLAIMCRSPNWFISQCSKWFIEFVRGTPLLVQLYFLFYILPDVGILLSPLVAGVIGLGLHYGTYTAEVYRAGIDNIPKGQWEAAKAVNLTKSQTWKEIIIPQAIPPMIPALANYIIAMFKETPLLSAITVLELMNQARSLSNFHYRYLEPMTMVGVFFLLISIPSVIFLRRLEQRYARPHH